MIKPQVGKPPRNTILNGSIAIDPNNADGNIIYKQ
jgi:hypothetical protein